MTSPFSILNKNILITGASSGLGRAMAVTFSEMGAKVFFTGRNAEALSETLKMMYGEGHQMLVSDLNKQADMELLIAQLPELDGVVSNAGVNKRTLTQYLKELDMDLILNTNLKAPMMLIKSLLKAKKIQTGASVVFISSIAAHHSSVGDGVYSASKGGLSSFAKVLALELASKKIRVNTIQPGMIRTGLTSKGPLSEDDYLKDEQKYPLGRYGQPVEVAHAAVYLLSDASKWITGTDLVIDGGISLI
jgi:NAD(P)-dependent dehydrogenase (short-subunit alcohol dehydrogenase family)